MIIRSLKDAIFDKISVPTDDQDEKLCRPTRATNSLSIWKNGKEIETYHIVMQVEYYRYDCWDVINGEFVTVQLE